MIVLPDECMFCKIAAKKVSTKVVYEDERTMAFEDINPQAPLHILIISKNHYRDVLDLVEGGYQDLKAVFNAITQVVNIKEMKEKGFRLVVNTGREAGQAVDHVHVHLLSGRKMKWPPG